MNTFGRDCHAIQPLFNYTFERKVSTDEFKIEPALVAMWPIRAPNFYLRECRVLRLDMQTKISTINNNNIGHDGLKAAETSEVYRFLSACHQLALDHKRDSRKCKALSAGLWKRIRMQVAHITKLFEAFKKLHGDAKAHTYRRSYNPPLVIQPAVVHNCYVEHKCEYTLENTRNVQLLCSLPEHLEDVHILWVLANYRKWARDPKNLWTPFCHSPIYDFVWKHDTDEISKTINTGRTHKCGVSLEYSFLPNANCFLPHWFYVGASSHHLMNWIRILNGQHRNSEHSDTPFCCYSDTYKTACKSEQDAIACCNIFHFGHK